MCIRDSPGDMAAEQPEQRSHERAAAADGVLEEAALAFVDAHGGATLEARARVGRIDTQLVGSMTRLVDCLLYTSRCV